MALSSSCSSSIGFGGISCPRGSPRKARHCLRHGQLGLAFSAEPEESRRPSSLRISADSTQKARFVARRKESVTVRQLERPLSNVRMDFLVLILRTVNWVFGKFWWVFLLLWQLSIWGCRRVSTRCWTRSELRGWMRTRLGVTFIGLSSLLLRFALFCLLEWKSSLMGVALASCLARFLLLLSTLCMCVCVCFSFGLNLVVSFWPLFW